MNIRVGRHNEPGAVYIGRAMPRLNRKASPLANPYKLRNPNDDAERDEVCDKYERWLDRQMVTNNPAICAEIERLAELAHRRGELVLGCFCAPKRCHGDGIREVINRTPFSVEMAELGWNITHAGSERNRGKQP